MKPYLKHVPFFFEPPFVAFAVGGMFYGLFGIVFGFNNAVVPSILIVLFILAFYGVRLLGSLNRRGKGSGDLANQFGTHHHACFKLDMSRDKALELMIGYLENNYTRYKPHEVDRPNYRLTINNKMKWFDSKNVIKIAIHALGDESCEIEIKSRPIFWIVIFDGGSNARIMNDFEDFLLEHGELKSRSSALF